MPYDFNLVHHLHPVDVLRRTDFCNWFLQMINVDIHFASKVIWLRECFLGDLSVLDFFFWGYLDNKIYDVPYERITSVIY